MAARGDVDIDEWETLDDDFPSASAASGAHYSKRLHAQPARRAGASHRGSAPQPAVSGAAMARSPRIWIVGILGLSVFWCVISLLAISRLEKRLPSEMQEQLEFHNSFSGLWPRNQGSNATAADIHHLPFAEASLGHKPRKQKASSPEGQTDEGSSPNADMESLADAGTGDGNEEPQQAPFLAAEAHGTEGEKGDADFWKSAVAALRNAFALEDKEMKLLRGVLSK